MDLCSQPSRPIYQLPRTKRQPAIGMQVLVFRPGRWNGPKPAVITSVMESVDHAPHPAVDVEVFGVPPTIDEGCCATIDKHLQRIPLFAQDVLITSTEPACWAEWPPVS